MDDFKLILGLEFLRDTRTMVLPHVDSLMMMGVKSCVIPTLAERTGEKNLSAMQFEKGRKRNEPSYLCTLRFEEMEEVLGPIPGGIKRLLREFEDVMPDELPRKLPPKRAVDHEIELVPGTRPPARAPYKMSQSKLMELRKQLKDMLESGIIKSAKSPYGATVLFQKKAGSIIVVVDRLSKYATFITAPKHVTAEGTAHLFFKHIVKYWGLPKDIISDRDSHFTSVFWTELFKLLGSTLSMSSSYHPQSDGQTERYNSMLEDYLRHFVQGTQKDWVKLLDVAQLCFNAQKSSSTNKSAFEIVTGQQPLLPNTLDTPQSVRSSLARSFSQEQKQNVDIARSFLEIAQKRMKKYADQTRRFIKFNAGDLVLVKVLDPRLSKSSRGRDPLLMQKYVGPLPFVRCIGTVAYKVELPPWWKIHNVFHMSQLKKYSANKEDDTRNQPSCPQLELTKTKEKVAEAILNHRVMGNAKRDHTEYLVKWRGCSSEENTWERVTNLKAFLPLVESYHASIAPGTSLSQVGEDVKGRPRTRHP
ncbi:UNVERIFIED_CONTAM: hypothetical protein Sindi_1425300 [Sesamum indicum]